jgi:hypothetical protein
MKGDNSGSYYVLKMLNNYVQQVAGCEAKNKELE